MLALLSCIFSGLRWALTQLLVHTTPDASSASRALSRRRSPISSIYYVTPACAACSAIGALLLERQVHCTVGHVLHVNSTCLM